MGPLHFELEEVKMMKDNADWLYFKAEGGRESSLLFFFPLSFQVLS